MDKCWFVLRQTHYPAPEYKHPGMAFGAAEGPICLGHFIPSPKQIDSVINSDSITPFPRSMRIWPTTAVDFRLSNNTTKGVQASAGVSAPIAAATGMTANAEAGVVFRKMMGDTWAIDRLDTQIVQPTMAYLEQCRSSAQIAAWVEKNKLLGSWKIYMISGLIIARGAKYERKEGTEAEQNGRGTAEAKIKHADTKKIDIAGRYLNDFVWAIRLTEVSKILFGSDLSQKVVRKGTVFAPGSDNVDVMAVMAKEGLEGGDIHALEVSNRGQQEFLIAINKY
ncbi:uncharacterized protein TRIVIDRAFT_160754 [Trichoderma virens Gv29-8]|uniref:Uncharacterized protein n=1 Tax=Hypocrea virens (strain Gv29-8 / FGSC 10586) TaxID=413071 RepID=G9N6J1_HYPVG|nr:uncharacterized protein TRIVIDRAFT_160754 [Trichoderma virens Gv29-8]EHK17751.1 hypothetical protein TRIVIDRAFT_160754 [Trichoderma virens Gv29-8]UKZ53534.1 hypothetical protein TrVGV298_007326 [Trichoderma virens]